jgi:hypothetical protein
VKAGIVANVVVPHPECVQFATHFRCRPDFLRRSEPRIERHRENRCGYAQRDLLLPALLEDEWPDLAAANATARAWCAEVNAQVHSAIRAGTHRTAGPAHHSIHLYSRSHVVAKREFCWARRGDRDASVQ